MCCEEDRRCAEKVIEDVVTEGDIDCVEKVTEGEFPPV